MAPTAFFKAISKYIFMAQLILLCSKSSTLQGEGNINYAHLL